jgi:hypothetical protein
VKAMEPLHARKIWWQEIREERLWFVRMSWRLL